MSGYVDNNDIMSGSVDNNDIMSGSVDIMTLCLVLSI